MRIRIGKYIWISEKKMRKRSEIADNYYVQQMQRISSQYSESLKEITEEEIVAMRKQPRLRSTNEILDELTEIAKHNMGENTFISWLLGNNELLDGYAPLYHLKNAKTPEEQQRVISALLSFIWK